MRRRRHDCECEQGRVDAWCEIVQHHVLDLVDDESRVRVGERDHYVSVVKRDLARFLVVGAAIDSEDQESTKLRLWRQTENEAARVIGDLIASRLFRLRCRAAVNRT